MRLNNLVSFGRVSSVSSPKERSKNYLQGRDQKANGVSSKDAIHNSVKETLENLNHFDPKPPKISIDNKIQQKEVN